MSKETAFFLGRDRREGFHIEVFMHTTLLRAVAEYALFLGLSKEEDVRPDVAVAQLEQLSRILNQLTADERADFTSFTRQMADEETRSPHASAERVALLQELSKHLGLDTYEQGRERGKYVALVKRIRAFFGPTLHPLASASLDVFALPEETKLFLQTIGLPGAGAESLLIHLYADASVLSVSPPGHGRLLVIGDDTGTTLVMKEGTGEILSIDPSGNLPARFVNSSVLTLLAFLATYANEQPTLAQANESEAIAMVARLTEQLRMLDAQALADADNWWPVVLEQLT